MPVNKLNDMIIEIIKDGQTQTYEISKPVLTLGRWHTCDIPINDINISREHLRLIINDSDIQIQDLKSSNGTLLNGTQISSKQTYFINESDTITFGNSFVTVKLKRKMAATQIMTKASEATVLIAEPESVVAKEKFEQPKEKSKITREKKDNAAAAAKLKAAKEAESVSVSASPTPDTYEESAVIHEMAPKAKVKAPEPEVSKDAIPDPLAGEQLINEAGISESLEKLKYSKDAAFNFKNVGLDLPKYKNSNEHAQEIIRDAEFLKHSIIKKGEASASLLIDKAKIQARQETEQIHQQCKDLVEQLLQNTKSNLERARIEADKIMSEKRLMLSDEIQLKWDEHDDLMQKEKHGHIEKIEKEHRVKLELSLEKLKTDMFIERDQQISNAENEILNKKRKFQLETSQEREIHLSKLREINVSIENLREEKETLIDAIQKVKAEFEKSELDFITASNNLKLISEKSIEAQKDLDRKLAEYAELEIKSKDVIELKNSMTQQEGVLKSSIEDLSRKYSNLAKKAEDEESKLATLAEQMENSKKLGNAQIEEEFKKTRDAEEKKYQNFKALELKSLQQIKDDHVESIKKFSLELSQEIASKLELLSKKSANQTYDYTKTVELVHSVIQVKSSDSNNIDAKHVEQLASWKKRQSAEKFKLMAIGFSACFVVFFTANYVYKTLRVDPFEVEKKRMAVERKQSEEENRFIPVKSEVWRSNYTELTLNTDQFVDVYLNDKNQEQWVSYITKYFLNQWKVSEEKVIAVVSSSKAYVQSVEEARPDLKKSKIKIELEKMKKSEEEIVAKNAALLGSQVRYEAYKKKEQEFFQRFMGSRAPASK